MRRNNLVWSLLSLVLVQASSLTACAQNIYVLTDLGIVKAPTNSSAAAIAYSINNAGQIAGMVLNTDGNQRAFRISPASVNGQEVWYKDSNNDGINDLMEVLPLLKGFACTSPAYNINNNGQVSATMRASAASPPYAAIWGSAVGSSPQILNLRNDYSDAYGINDGSDVVTLSHTANSPILWQFSSGKYVSKSIAPLSGYSAAWPRGMNNNRQITGYFGQLNADSTQDSWIWSPTQGMSVLGRITGQPKCQAQAINSAGLITGRSYTGIIINNIALAHLFQWTPGGTDGDPNNPQMKDLGTPSSYYDSVFGYCVNNLASPQIVGTALSSAGGTPHAYVWENGMFTDLNSVTVNLPVGAVLVSANGINDLGQIVGSYSYYPAGASAPMTRAFFLTPQ